MTNGIILAAGRGKRLKKFTKFKPKSLNKHQGQTFADLIINNFKANKITNINLITGYRKNQFNDYKINKIYNKKWKTSNIFFSLYSAKNILKKKTCIISYSDIIYDKSAINILKKSKGDIVILNNMNWEKSWKLRFKYPLDDLESFKIKLIKKKRYLKEIGNKPRKISEIKGQFCGLFKITPIGWKKVLRLISEKKFNIKNQDMTSVFSFIIKHEKKLIRVANYKGKWFEIDTVKDFKLLKEYNEQ